jgi:hypothetical protein
VSTQLSIPIYARLGERELPVRWAWYRPEPQVGDTVRLPMAPGGNDGWQSFRVVGKQVSDTAPVLRTSVVADPAPLAMIHLDVEPIALQD